MHLYSYWDFYLLYKGIYSFSWFAQVKITQMQKLTDYTLLKKH